MPLMAYIAHEEAGRPLPLTQTRRPEAVYAVALAALRDLREATVPNAPDAPDECATGLRAQEHQRLSAGCDLLGGTEKDGGCA